MGRRAFVALVLLALLAFTAPAGAANQSVSVVNVAFTPGTVTIDPGETVTWTWESGTHNVTSNPGQTESFDSGTHSRPHSFSRAFATPGTYEYYCTVHSTPDGSAQNGKVVVTDGTAPVAAFTVAPDPASVGQPVTFDGAASSDASGIARYQWDLDGDGRFETDTGTTPLATWTYTSVGAIRTALRVTDRSGATSQTARTLAVTAGSGAITLAPETTTVTFGSTARLAGSYFGESPAGIGIALQQSPFPFKDPFAQVAGATTGVDGGFAFSVKPGQTTRFQAVSSTDPVATSTATLVAVRPRLTLRLSNSKPAAGARVRFRGSLAPAHTGSRVVIERSSGGGRYREVARPRLRRASPLSTFEAPVRVTRSALFRARFVPDGDHVAAASPALRVRVR